MSIETPTKEELHNQLIEACENGVLVDVKKLIAMAAPLEEPQSALTVACENGRLSVVKYLLTNDTQQADINGKEDQGTPLFWACLTGRTEIVNYLLLSNELKEHANLGNDGQVLIARAVEYGYTDVLDILLSLNPPIDLKRGKQKWALVSLPESYPHAPQVACLEKLVGGLIKQNCVDEWVCGVLTYASMKSPDDDWFKHIRANMDHLSSSLIEHISGDTKQQLNTFLHNMPHTTHRVIEKEVASKEVLRPKKM